MAQHTKEDEELVNNDSSEDLSNNKEDKSFSQKIVSICIIMNVIFTIAIFATKIFNYYIVIPDSLIIAWFGFWGAELVSLASIKKDKIKNKYY